MCGRYTLATPEPVLQEVFELGAVPELTARYNIAPTQWVPAVIEFAGEGQRRLEMLRWGLIPSWAKDPAIGAKMINARGETVRDKPAFRAAFKRRRCLIPADGFYEWQKPCGPPFRLPLRPPSASRAESARAKGRGSPGKQPYLIYLANREPFAFAGLWESWNDPDGHDLRTCTIITTEANELMEPLHDRMPVILHREDYATWLSPDLQDADQVQDLVVPFESRLMACHPVSTAVNNPRHDNPVNVAPIALESQGEFPV